VGSNLTVIGRIYEMKKLPASELQTHTTFIVLVCDGGKSSRFHAENRGFMQ
jgi:hypothetical protein